MQLINNLKRRIQKPLPGAFAQYEMAPLGRKEFAQSVTDYTTASVLALLYPKASEWHMVFIKRTSHKHDRHSAQISFPGGKMEESDESYVANAVREAKEEIGLEPTKVQIIGELSSLQIPVSGFEVFPVLAYYETAPLFIPQISEVADIIELPLDVITNNSFKRNKNIALENGVNLQNVPVFQHESTTIWGATAMILNEIIHLIE